ncbi:hypothetical protein LTR15_004408 [Elasticomyces elasticus]|nr:hypothetical protein LTR15_004408 [Elasticomyces elasticus]
MTDDSRRAINVNIGDLTTLGSSNTVNAGVFFNGEDQATKIERCRNAIFLTDPEIDRAGLVSAKGKRVEGTCEWIKKDAAYQSWHSGDANLLWISGGPGRGKTILSIYLTQQLEKEGDVIYYFCSNDDENRNTAVAVLRGLIWHITARRSELAVHLLEPLSDKRRAQSTLTSRETLWNMFVKIMQDCGSSSIACVLDGLDECDEESQRWLVAKLVDVHTLELDNSHLRLAIVSRPLPGLSRSSQVKLDPDNEAQVGRDVTRFVAARVRELAERVNLQETALRMVENTLLERSEGTFLWVGFAMLELLKQQTTTGILEALQTLPKGLPAMYSRMLTQIDDDQKATCDLILQWVALAVRPLTLLELAEATGTNATERLTQEQVIRDEVEACGALVRIGAQTVGLVHQSARDYLLRSAINSKEGHYGMALSCVRMVEHIDWLGWERPVQLFEDYSKRFWPNHAKSSGALAGELPGRSRMFDEKSRLRDRWWNGYYHLEGATTLPVIHIASYLGIVPWVQALINQRKMPLFQWHSKAFHRLVNSHDIKGRSPLWWAELGGNKDTAQLLIANGARLEVGSKAQQGTDALVMASRVGQEAIVRVLLVRGVGVDSRMHSTFATFAGGTALQAASREGHQATVRLLLEYGADANAQVGGSGSALQAASHSGHEAIVRLLLAEGADVNAQENGCWSALEAACSSGHERIARLLLEVEADVNERRSGGSALHCASANGHEETVRLILAAGADVNAQGGYCINALQAACYWRHEAVVRLLLEHDAVENWNDEWGDEAERNYKEMLKKWNGNYDHQIGTR